MQSASPTPVQSFNRIVVFGVGLIGGSFALALKQANLVKQVTGVGRRAETLQRAQALGIIDTIGDATSVSGADLVLIAAPVAQTEALLRELAPYLQAGTVVTDAGSTKGDVVKAARAALGDKIAQFVPGHPIAGREQNGPEAALPELYRGKKVVLTAVPENSPQSISTVASAWRYCGAQIHHLGADEHDAIFAAVSHLPHLLAYALVDDIAARDNADRLFQYAASGFRDFTRIAGSSPEMWRDISLANRAALLVELDAYAAQLSTLRAMLAASDGTALEQVYVRAQSARQAWIAAIETAEQARSYEQGGD
ncbi:MAG: prephenate dehydrogenase/arogenate dehydrogenase family protein [Oxalobacteraceae bacterium]|nr:prephenate dehydrogenase/arogenate dehydrogenase family protein [Oxalobacteraceae bacterium]